MICKEKGGTKGTLSKIPRKGFWRVYFLFNFKIKKTILTLEYE